VVTLCRKHELWEGLICVYNNGLGDYLTPLDYMMQSLQSLIANPPPVELALSAHKWSAKLSTLASKILTYLARCLRGAAQPCCSLCSLRARGADGVSG